MRKRTCVLAIVLLLVAGPVLAADQSDNRPASLRAAFAWVLGLVGYGDVERTAPDVHQRLGLEVLVGGEAAPPEDSSSDSTQQEPEAIPDGSV